MENETFDDDVITQFCDIADTTPDVAKNYLSVILKAICLIFQILI